MKEMLNNISLEEKALLFDSVFSNEYETLIRIEPASGEASTLYSGDPAWKKTMQSTFLYDEVLRQYLLLASVDTEPEKTLAEMSLPAVREKLRARPFHAVYYSVNSRDLGIRMKKAVYIKKEPVVFLAIQDLSDAFHHISDKAGEMENALLQTKKEISKKEAFLSMMDQNLRTPLYSIMGLTHIAEENPESLAFDDYLYKIAMYGSYMTETIDDMLTLRRIARKQRDLRPVVIYLGDFFSGIERLIHPAISQKKLLFDMDTSNVDPLHIVADLRCMQQIVLKMLRSAIWYTVKGGRIRLHARMQKYDGKDVQIEISVENRGLVMDQERLNLLLKPYEYITDHFDKNTGDLDIALIILRHNLLAMGSNTITVESDERRGTRISVCLTVPLAEGEEAAITGEVPDFTGKRVLLVDDNEISLEVSEKLLQSKGIETITAANGREAVDIFIREKGRFDMILMDVLMPVMDGLDAARGIRNLADLENARTIPIIALTVNAFRENFEESLKAGMNAHLVKPIEPGSLYRILTQYLG